LVDRVRSGPTAWVVECHVTSTTTALDSPHTLERATQEDRRNVVGTSNLIRFRPVPCSSAQVLGVPIAGATVRRPNR